MCDNSLASASTKEKLKNPWSEPHQEVAIVALVDDFSALQAVLYMRIGFILECMLREMRASDRGLAVLDAADPEDWVQGMVRFKSGLGLGLGRSQRIKAAASPS